MQVEYSGPERRRSPRNANHRFGIVYVRGANSWLAREILVLDLTDLSARIRSLPRLEGRDFRLQIDGESNLRNATIMRRDEVGDYWQYVLEVSQPVGTETFGDLPVVFDFPRPAYAVA